MSIKLPKIFLDSGNPEETKKAKGMLGFIDGQTTNPSLVVKNPEIATYIEKGKKLTEKELLYFYKQIVIEIRKEIAGSISIEVYADWETKASTMLKQAEEMNSWIRNAHIKFPAIPEGLKAAHEFVKKGGKVNVTLVFDQQQAAGVYFATLNQNNPEENHHPHFVSPFIGRWDDKGYLGLDLVKNMVKMYKKYDKQRKMKNPHVILLAASIRSLEHLYGSIFLGADIITIPLKLIYEWIQEQKWMPDTTYRIESHGLKSILYQEVAANPDFSKYDIKKVKGTLLEEGIAKFVGDWKKLLV